MERRFSTPIMTPHRTAVFSVLACSLKGRIGEYGIRLLIVKEQIFTDVLLNDAAWLP